MYEEGNGIIRPGCTIDNVRVTNNLYCANIDDNEKTYKAGVGPVQPSGKGNHLCCANVDDSKKTYKAGVDLVPILWPHCP